MDQLHDHPSEADLPASERVPVPGSDRSCGWHPVVRFGLGFETLLGLVLETSSCDTGFAVPMPMRPVLVNATLMSLSVPPPGP